MAVTASNSRPSKEQLASVSSKYNRAQIYSGIAMDFNGTSTYIPVGSLDDFCATVCFFIKPASANESIVDFDGGTHTIEISSGTITATGFDTPVIYVNNELTSSIIVGQWSFVAITNSSPFTISDLEIGRISTSYYEGLMSCFSIYSVQLSQAQSLQILLDANRVLPTGLEKSNLVVWYPLFETTSTVFEANGNNKTAVDHGYQDKQTKPVLQLATTGKNEKIEFNGSNVAVNIGSRSSTDNLSISCWIMTSTFNRSILSFGSASLKALAATLIQFQGNGNVQWTIDNYSNKWIHLVLVKTLHDATLYLNGVKVSTEAINAVSSANITSYIGRAGASFFSGIIDEVAYWDKALQSDEALQIYNEGNALDVTKNKGAYQSRSNLLGYYRNQAKTDWIDRSGNNNTGTISGTPASSYYNTGIQNDRDILGTPLVFERGNFFNNADSVASLISNKDTEVTAITISCWIKAIVVGGFYIIAKDSSYSLQVNSSGEIVQKVFVPAENTHTSTTADIQPDLWYYISASYEDGTAKIYLNGQMISENTGITGDIATNQNRVFIGALDISATTPLNGLLDDLKIYDRVLTDDEQLTNYKATLNNHIN